jgi:DNA-3-methyladenine glycosylase I
MSGEWISPSWMYRGRRPPNDASYFENLTRCIFQAGLNWRVISNKWLNFKKVFDDFQIDVVASYGISDIKRLLEDEGIIRNRKKILATIENAREFEKVSLNYGGFQLWLDGLDKSNNYSNVVKQLISRFNHVGGSTARIFLYSVGEPIQHDATIQRRRRRCLE